MALVSLDAPPCWWKTQAAHFMSAGDAKKLANTDGGSQQSSHSAPLFGSNCHKLLTLLPKCRFSQATDKSCYSRLCAKSHQRLLLLCSRRLPGQVHLGGHQHALGLQSQVPVHARGRASPQSAPRFPVYGHAEYLVRCAHTGVSGAEL